MKDLTVNLTKEANEIYEENCKSLLKEIEADTRKRTHIHCS